MKNVHPAIATLLCQRWDDGFGFLHHLSEKLLGEARSQTLLDALCDRKTCQAEIRDAVDFLYEIGTVEAGAQALAWSTLTCDPRRPETFIRVLPQLQHALEASDLSADDDGDVRARVRFWWRCAGGEFAKEKGSAFSVTNKVLFDPPEPEPKPLTLDEAVLRWMSKPFPGPTMVVMPAAKASKLTPYNRHFTEIVDKPLPLVIARGLDEARKRLGYEFPHAAGAMQTLFKELREGQPVKLRPTILVSPPGTGKTRFVRRFAEAIGIQTVFRYDGSAGGDNHFAGVSKSWSNAEPSVPARAVLTSRTANPIVFIDEIDKPAVNRNTGSLWSALLGFAEVESAKRYRDQGLDSELDLSACNFLCTANDVTVLPDHLRDRFRIIRIPQPRLVDLPLLAASVMEDLGREDEERAWDDPLAPDELQVIAKAWQAVGFSLRKLQSIVRATLEARDQFAMRH
jgi:ATP-dependent Lon protease